MPPGVEIFPRLTVSPEMVEFLLEHGANVGLTNADDHTALDESYHTTANDDIFRELMAYDIDALRKAILTDQVEFVGRVVAIVPELLHRCDSDGVSGLQLAIEKRRDCNASSYSGSEGRHPVVYARSNGGGSGESWGEATATGSTYWECWNCAINYQRSPRLLSLLSV